MNDIPPIFNCNGELSSSIFRLTKNHLKVELTFHKGKLRLFQDKIDLCSNSKKIKDTTRDIFSSFGIVPGCPNNQQYVRIVNCLIYQIIHKVFRLSANKKRGRLGWFLKKISTHSELFLRKTWSMWRFALQSSMTPERAALKPN